MSNVSLIKMVAEIKSVMPPQTLFSDKDAQVFKNNQDLLLSIGEKLIQGFYAVVGAHAPTKVIFDGDDMGKRASDLKVWWQRSVTGPFDDAYWVWQAFVGVIHVKRGVKNAMMMSMWGWIMDFVNKELADKTDPQNAYQILQSLGRLSATAQALAADSFLETYLSGILRATGFSKKLLDKMVENEINQLVAEAR